MPMKREPHALLAESIDLPVAEAGAIVVAPAEPAVVKHEPLDAKAKKPARMVLRMTLKLSNVGVARMIPFKGWSGEAMPKLTVANGSRVAFIKMETAAAGVNPGKDAEIVLLFEPPPAVKDALMLELPAIAFEGQEAVKFRIPAAMVQR